ncbi:MAG: nucleotidyl transferase AbiEii/AbiGii toxin family protein [Rhodospirillaceae bacterium]|nr:nucleotidyl transferase AbiEii/AbiGii toxin family protein [Rhodospirillaceae bacterium]
MTEDAFASFLALPERDRRDAFAVAARRLDTVPGYVEKDFWVCLVLDALFNRLPGGHPELLFKGGTSLSKAFRLIRRFSEDIDLVVGRDGLGFAGERDPTIAAGLSNKRRSALFDELAQACGRHVQGDLKTALTAAVGELTEGCALDADPDDGSGQTLLVAYPTLYPGADPALLDAVRNHNLIAFRQAWKRFEEAVPGSLRLVPQPELHAAIARDYRAMRDMILGDAPAFDWIVDRLRDAEVAANRI